MGVTVALTVAQSAIALSGGSVRAACRCASCFTVCSEVASLVVPGLRGAVASQKVAAREVVPHTVFGRQPDSRMEDLQF